MAQTTLPAPFLISLLQSPYQVKLILVVALITKPNIFFFSSPCLCPSPLCHIYDDD